MVFNGWLLIYGTGFWGNRTTELDVAPYLYLGKSAVGVKLGKNPNLLTSSLIDEYSK